MTNQKLITSKELAEYLFLKYSREENTSWPNIPIIEKIKWINDADYILNILGLIKDYAEYPLSNCCNASIRIGIDMSHNPFIIKQVICTECLKVCNIHERDK